MECTPTLTLQPPPTEYMPYMHAWAGFDWFHDALQISGVKFHGVVCTQTPARDPRSRGGQRTALWEQTQSRNSHRNGFPWKMMFLYQPPSTFDSCRGHLAGSSPQPTTRKKGPPGPGHPVFSGPGSAFGWFLSSMSQTLHVCHICRSVGVVLGVNVGIYAIRGVFGCWVFQGVPLGFTSSPPRPVRSGPIDPTLQGRDSEGGNIQSEPISVGGGGHGQLRG